MMDLYVFGQLATLLTSVFVGKSRTDPQYKLKLLTQYGHDSVSIKE